MKHEELLHLFSPYLPTDRFRALLRNGDLPVVSEGAALLADISGFTPMTTQFVTQFGPERASEEVKRKLNPMFEAIAGQVFHHGGSVIRFTGDGFIAWFSDNDPEQTLNAEVIIPAALRAISAGLGMQAVMPIFRGLRLKVCVGTGRTFRWVVGHPQYGLTDVLLGPAVDEMLSLAGEVQPGQIMIHRQSVGWLRREQVKMELNDTGNATVTSLPEEISKAVRQYRWLPWSVESNIDDALNAVRPFVDSAIRERVESGFGDYVAELRYAIPMFVQLNSIAPAAEGARDLLDKQVRSAQSVLASFGGRFVSVEMGDKGSVIFAVFGAPISYGDDAERAVRAALALRDMSAGGASGLSIERIGLSRGLLYAGTIGGEVRHEYSTIGDETNIASRLMTAAESGQILTTSSVRHEVGPRIAFHDLDPINVKGRTEPISITEPSSVLQGIQQQAHVGELVGRTEELDQLHALAQAAANGYPRIVRVEGQAGIGKSRLVAELVRLAVDEGFFAAGGDCVSTGRNMAYLPWRDVLISLLGLNAEASLDETTDRIYNFVEQANEDWLPRVPLLGDLLQLPMADSSITMTLEGQTRHQALSTLVVEIILYIARKQPILIVMEDTHWMDELSESLMIDLARQLNVDPAPVMAMLVHRPLTEADHPLEIIRVLSDMHHHSHLTLNELNRAAVTEMIEKYVDASIPLDLSRFVYDRAHGNPFFVQELVDTLIETGFIKVIGSLVFIERDLNAADLPHTVQKLVQARIDRLNETDKLVLKVAAVIGQQFQVNVLAKSIPIALTYEELLDCLRTLEARDFSYMESPEPELTYLFKHAITQEVTYQSLLFAQRRQLHQAVASTLEILAPDATDRLAYHFVRGGDTDRARHYLLMAGEKAYREYANQAALTYFNQVQPMARNDHERFDIDRRRLQIMLRLGDTQGVQRDMPDLQALAVRNERLDWQAECHIFWANYHVQTSSWGKVIEEAQRAIAASKQIKNDALAWESYLLLRDAFLEINQREEAEALNTTLRPIADRLGDPHRRIRLELLESEDLYATNPTKAVEGAEAAIGEAKALQDPILEADGWSTLARLHSRNNNLPSALHAYGQQIALLRQVGDRRHEGLTLLSIGGTLVSMGELSEGNAHLLDAYKILHQIGERSGEAASLVNLGIIAQHHKAYDEGLAYMERGLTIQRELTAEADVARTLFYMGNVFIQQKKLNEAVAALAEAESLFAANNLPQHLDEISTARSEIDALRNDLETARTNIRPLLPRLARHQVEDIFLPGLAYWRAIHILKLRGEDSLATQLHESFRDFINPILNSLTAARREAFINKIWYHAALLNGEENS